MRPDKFDCMDNEGARESLIGSTSTSCAARELVFHIKLEDTTISPFDWFARFPTQAKIADCASRLDFEPLLQLEAEQKHPKVFALGIEGLKADNNTS